MSAETRSASADAAPEFGALTAYFARRHPDSEAWLSDFRRAASGFSNETRFFTLHLRKDGRASSRALVARWAPLENRQFEAYDVAFQFHALEALAGTPVPVPEPVLLETDPSVLGGPFFVMASVEGDTTSDYPPGYHGAGFLFEAGERDRAAVWWRSLEVMGEVHRVDWEAPPFAFIDKPRDGADAIQRRIDHVRRLVDWGSATPIGPIERALAWLGSNKPSASPLTLCWGDPRPGNILFRDHRPVAALDWEGLHIGPPETDLAWFLLVDEVAYRAHGQARLAGLPGWDETISRYEAMMGRRVEKFEYYLVLGAALLSALMVITAKNIASKGIAGFPEDYATNNVAIARLKELLHRVV